MSNSCFSRFRTSGASESVVLAMTFKTWRKSTTLVKNTDRFVRKLDKMLSELYSKHLFIATEQWHC